MSRAKVQTAKRIGFEIILLVFYVFCLLQAFRHRCWWLTAAASPPWKHRRGCFCGMILHNFRCARGRTSTSFDALNWFTPRTQLPPPHPLVLFSCTLASRTILAYPGISCSPFFRAVMHLYLIKHFLRVSVESIISLARLEFHYGPTRDWVENTLGFHPIVIKFPRP